MKVKICRGISQLYDDNNLSINVSIEWILGYCVKEFGNQIPGDLFNMYEHDYLLVDINDDIVMQAKKKFNPAGNIDGLINFLCLMAFSLGGGE